MDKVYDKCCGIDVHKMIIVCCLKKGNEQEIREFSAETKELIKIAKWLKEKVWERRFLQFSLPCFAEITNIFAPIRKTEADIAIIVLNFIIRFFNVFTNNQICLH